MANQGNFGLEVESFLNGNEVGSHSYTGLSHNNESGFQVANTAGLTMVELLSIPGSGSGIFTVKHIEVSGSVRTKSRSPNPPRSACWRSACSVSDSQDGNAGADR
jgi:hypothetical protein